MSSYRSLELLFPATVGMKMTTLYRFQKSINKRNTQVNGSLLKFTYFCAYSCPRSCLCVLFMRFLHQHNSIFVSKIKMQILNDR